MKNKTGLYEEIKYIDLTALKILLATVAIAVAWMMNEAPTISIGQLNVVESIALSQLEHPPCPPPLSDEFCAANGFQNQTSQM